MFRTLSQLHSRAGRSLPSHQHVKGCQVIQTSLSRHSSCRSSTRFFATAEARKREAEELRKKGFNASYGADTLDGGSAVLVGLAFACWYFGWLESKVYKPDELAKWLRSQEVSVIVFELDKAVCTKERTGTGVFVHEMEDYCSGISHDFVDVAKALSFRSFHLAVIVDDTGRTPLAPPPTEVSRSWFRRSEVPPPAPGQVTGPELARQLIVRRAPELIASCHFFGHEGIEETAGEAARSTGRSSSSRKASAAQRTDQMLWQVADFYNVPLKKLAFVTASEAKLKNSSSWTGIQVRNEKEGFRWDDAMVLALEARDMTGLRKWLPRFPRGDS